VILLRFAASALAIAALVYLALALGANLVW
jgi:hypothetical protein